MQVISKLDVTAPLHQIRNLRTPVRQRPFLWAQGWAGPCPPRALAISPPPPIPCPAVLVGPAVGQAKSDREIAGSIPGAYQTPTRAAPMCSGQV